jgi:hypothetical protein
VFCERHGGRYETMAHVPTTVCTESTVSRSRVACGPLCVPPELRLFGQPLSSRIRMFAQGVRLRSTDPVRTWL